MMANRVRGLVVLLILSLIEPAGFGGESEVHPLVIGGVEYRAKLVRVGSDLGSPIELQAIDLKTRAELWRVSLEGATLRGVELAGAKPRRVVALESFASGLVVKSNEGSTFFVEPSSRRFELVRDLRRQDPTCPIHHRPLQGCLVPIRYGRISGEWLANASTTKPPRFVSGGCCVLPEKSALLRFCPDCP